MSSQRSPFASAAPATAEEEAYDYILERVRLGHFKPGDRIKSEDIAAATDMSRMPVREAFRRLATEGLLVLRPNRGASVVTLSAADIEEIFAIRAALEGLAARYAVEHFDGQARGDLAYLLGRMEYARQVDSADWLTAHRQFHEYVCAIARRPRLLRQIASLYTVLEPYMRLWLVHTEQPHSASVQSEHREIVNALASGDADWAEQTIREHIVTTTADLTRVL